MFRKIQILAFSAMVAVGGSMATSESSYAGHRGHVTFGIGVGFGSSSYYDPWRHQYRPSRRYGRSYRHHYRYRDPFPGYYVPAYRRYQPPIVYRPRTSYRPATGSAHVQWCHSRYRSYRTYDNTFQPYHGPRRQCRSPYF
jgi:hypothetical protein